MLRLILTKFWPVLIPIAIYLIWRFFIFNRLKGKHEEKKLKALYLLLISTLLSLIISILIFFFSESKEKTRHYTPAKIVGDKIQPATVK